MRCRWPVVGPIVTCKPKSQSVIRRETLSRKALLYDRDHTANVRGRWNRLKIRTADIGRRRGFSLTRACPAYNFLNSVALPEQPGRGRQPAAPACGGRSGLPSGSLWSARMRSGQRNEGPRGSGAVALHQQVGYAFALPGGRQERRTRCSRRASTAKPSRIRESAVRFAARAEQVSERSFSPERPAR